MKAAAAGLLAHVNALCSQMPRVVELFVYHDSFRRTLKGRQAISCLQLAVRIMATLISPSEEQTGQVSMLTARLVLLFSLQTCSWYKCNTSK